MDKFKVPVSMLAPQVDPAQLGFQDTSQLDPLDGTIGQDRAVEALTFGLQMKSDGFNIYVAGPVGTGKGTLVRQMVKQMAASAPSPCDWCYVTNFKDPTRPSALSFPAGQGAAFSRDMTTFIESLQRDVPAVFEGKAYLEAKAKLLEEAEGKKKSRFRELTELCRDRGFGFEETPVGFGLVPLKSGKPMSEKDLAALSPEVRHELSEKRGAVESEIRSFQVRIQALERETEQRVQHLDRQVVANVMQARYDTLRQTSQDLDRVCAYLDQVREDILHQYKDFLPRESGIPPIPGLESTTRRSDLARYQVNLIVAHQAGGGAPVIDESHPTYTNLIGRIDRKTHLGVMYTDFTHIKAGSVLLASGGVLLLQAADVLRQPFSWEALKRVVKTGQVMIEDPGDFFGFSTVGLRPEPIPVSVKIVLLGSSRLYRLLQGFEEDFSKLFKVKADFDCEVRRDKRHDRQYARFVAKICCDEGLLHFAADAVAEVIRQAARLADHRDRLSLRFGLLSDLVREAGYWARGAGHSLVVRTDVEAAIAHKRYRSNLPEQWMQEEIREGTLMVDVSGEVVGQVNGLSVYQLGDAAFGRPTRITARTFVGSKGVIDIQREAELAGHIHSKGVLTLAGFLAGKFAEAQPFALTATLTSEQTYSEVEGDSAALAELIAILSSLAERPVRQSLAITGSVNQLGEVQPIGGVNEKIEGFFDSCTQRGLTRNQGVLIPARNTKHLALRREVVEAAEDGSFAIYGVNTVEEALELVTGLPAGERTESGEYPADTVYGRAAKRLAALADVAASWERIDRKSISV